MTMSRYSQKLPSQCCSRKCVLSRRLSTSEINGFVFVGIVFSPNKALSSLSLNLPVCFVYRKRPAHMHGASATTPFHSIGKLGAFHKVRHGFMTGVVTDFYCNKCWQTLRSNPIVDTLKDRSEFQSAYPSTRNPP